MEISTRECFDLATANLKATANRSTNGDLGTVYWEARMRGEAHAVVFYYAQLPNPAPEDQEKADYAAGVFKTLDEALEAKAESGDPEAIRALGWDRAREAA